MLLKTYRWTAKHSFIYCYVGPRLRVSFPVLISCYKRRPQNRVAYTKNEAHRFPTRQSTACMVALSLVSHGLQGRSVGLQGRSSCHHLLASRQGGRGNTIQPEVFFKEVT